MADTFDLGRVTEVVSFLIKEHVVASKRELATLMDYTESSMSVILNGKTPLSAKFLKRLASVDSRINLDYLLGTSDSMLGPELSISKDGNIVIPARAWAVIEKNAASLTARDRQIDALLESLSTRDAQLDEVISMLRSQINK